MYPPQPMPELKNEVPMLSLSKVIVGTHTHTRVITLPTPLSWSVISLYYTQCEPNEKHTEQYLGWEESNYLDVSSFI